MNPYFELMPDDLQKEIDEYHQMGKDILRKTKEHGERVGCDHTLENGTSAIIKRITSKYNFVDDLCLICKKQF